MQLFRGFELFGFRSQLHPSWNIASWHSPHSATWRWLLVFALVDVTRGETRHAWPIFWRYKHAGSAKWSVRIPWIGSFDFHTQQPSWYRDLYMRLSDEQAQRERRLWLRADHPHKLPDVPPPLPAPTVDGGLSRH